MADCSQRQRPGDTQIGNVVDGKAKQCALGVAAVSSSQPVEQGLHAVRLERGVGERLLGDASAKLFQATGVRPDARKLEKLLRKESSITGEGGDSGTGVGRAHMRRVRVRTWSTV